MGKLYQSLKFLLLAGMTISLVGCGDKLYPVSGVVKIDGKPFENGSVTIVPVQGGPPGFGGTDKDGNFTLETGNKSGVRAGTYKVALQKLPSGQNAQPKGKDMDEDALARKGEFEVAPGSPDAGKFSNPETSGLTITVPSGDGKYVIDGNSK